MVTVRMALAPGLPSAVTAPGPDPLHAHLLSSPHRRRRRAGGTGDQRCSRTDDKNTQGARDRPAKVGRSGGEQVPEGGPCQPEP
ncbi:hypothetical protein AAFF_G00140600 [Aldrovandia affinis]|uniref:Uncharacterized protein n=1 Tax=Aldrovandia affinis TaxID=143900 RepID=A0AAD7TCE7_9TELE|nr:hypothetical protein AAFF_G00140600 [Aldrovandia affinis]